MNRKEFLSSLGFSAAALALTSCLGGCEKDENNNMEDSINNLNLSPNDKVEIIGLLKMMLVINPNNRCSIKNLINHTFFT